MMALFLIATLVVYLYKIRFAPRGIFFFDYSDQKNTILLQGILVILVFFRHLSEYLNNTSVFDHAFLLSEKLIGQMMVGGFLFLSGFGIMQSFQRKPHYLETFWRRFLRVLIPFDIAVVIYLIIGMIMGNSYSVNHILLSFVGFHSVGNSCWYIFATLVAYALFYLSFRSIKNIDGAIVCFLVTSIIYCLLIGRIKEDYWYSTFLCFAVGITYSRFKSCIDTHIMTTRRYMLTFFALLILTAIFNVLRYKSVFYYIIGAIVFCLSMMTLSMKLLPYDNNKVLSFLGRHTFSIYILQRIPMNLMKHYLPGGYNNFVFSIISFAVTLILAVIFDFVMDKLLRRIRVIG